ASCGRAGRAARTSGRVARAACPRSDCVRRGGSPDLPAVAAPDLRAVAAPALRAVAAPALRALAAPASRPWVRGAPAWVRAWVRGVPPGWLAAVPTWSRGVWA